MSTTPLLENIREQPTSLRVVAAYQSGAGRDALTRAAGLLSGAKRIVLSGMGASFFALAPLAYELTRAGVPVATVESSELLHFLQPAVDSGTVVLLVSRSGESIEVIKLLPELKRRGASVIGVSNVPGSTLERSADAGILLGSPADQLVAIQTYTGTVAVLALLAAAKTGTLEEAGHELEGAARLLENNIPDWIERRAELDAFLRTEVPIYILGRGPALSSVTEGALLFHETAKWTAIGLSSAQFRHGPVEVVDGRFRAVVLGTARETAELDAALANDLAGMGADVRWIGAPSQSGPQPLMDFPGDIPTRFAQIVDVVPLQIAAYRKAELNGVRPGDFRWAPVVTTTESGFARPADRN